MSACQQTTVASELGQAVAAVRRSCRMPSREGGSSPMNLLHGRSQTKTDLYVSGNPGKLIEVSQDGQGVRTGKSSFGVVKQVRLEYTSEVNKGDDVLVHVG